MNPRLRLLLNLAIGAAVGHADLAAADDRAVVVGIDSYPEIDLPWSLGQARTDATRFRDFLVAHQGFSEDEVTVLLDEEATSDAIVDGLIDRLVAETEAGDRAVFFFAGLGSRIPDANGDEPDGEEEVLLAHDTASILGKISEDAIAEILDLIADRKVTAIIDASSEGSLGTWSGEHGGPLTRGVDLDQTQPLNRAAMHSRPATRNPESFREEPFAAAGNDLRDVWAAAAPSQVAWEMSNGGVFTTAYIEGLAEGSADLNGNGMITNAELLAHLREEAAYWCASVPSCNEAGFGLTPDFSGDVQAIAGRVTAGAARPSAGESSSRPRPVVQAAAPADAMPADLDLTPKTEWPAPPAAGPQDSKAAAPAETLPPNSHADALGFVTDLLAPTNAANLRLEIVPSTRLKVGEYASFDVLSERSGALVLLDVNPAGELFQVFPSELSRPGVSRIVAHEALTIPEATGFDGLPLRIRVIEPAGKGFLLALFVESDLPKLEAVLPENLSGGPIPNAGQYLYEIAQGLLRLQSGAGGNLAVKWSATYLPYEIVR